MDLISRLVQMQGIPNGYVLDTPVVRDFTEQDLVEEANFLNAIRAELRPGDPPIPAALHIARFRAMPFFVEKRICRVRDHAGKLVALALGEWDTKAEDNLHLLDTDLLVLADHRRRGIGSALLQWLVDLAESTGRRLLHGNTYGASPAGSEFAQRVGSFAGQEVRISRLLLSEVDPGLINKWVTEGPLRAPGYDLHFVDGVYPRELYDQIIHAYGFMNSAPRDDLQVEDWKLTHDDLDAWNHELTSTGGRRWSLFAVHNGSGQFVGETEIGWNPSVTGLRYQYGTAVDPAHRGHAIGKWLKAEMIRKILDEQDDASEIRTGNAESNAAMLGINVALGFKPHFSSTTWQLETKIAREYLSIRAPLSHGTQ